jgi:prephenate dehydratase
MKVALLGPPGTFTHQAAEQYFSKCDPVFRQTMGEVMEHEGVAKILPFENSLGGGVAESWDLLREHRPQVTGETLLEIEHCLLSDTSIAEIDRVRSHPQALDQCRSFIDDHRWETIEASSTARAAEEIGDDEAAIASALAGELNDLDVIAHGIQDRRSVTRFLVLDDRPTGGEKTSIILEPGSDAPGLLHELLGCFADRGINLSYIQSRPTKDEMGAYYFYLEAEEPAGTARFDEAVRCLEQKADVTDLGSYDGADPV